MTAEVIAICGAPGAGKTSVCQSLAGQLDAEIISMDVDAAYTTMSPAQLSDWVDAGADYNIFALPELAEELAGRDVGVVLFESHFGRPHRQTGQYISQQIYLQLPLELALARQLEKICTDFIGSGVAEMEQLHWFKGFLQAYQNMLAPLLVAQSEHLAANADLVIDASRPLGMVVSEVADYLRE